MKKFAICLSLSNLFFIQLWLFFIYDKAHWFYFGTLTAMDFAALIINVFLLALILWAGAKLEEKFKILRPAAFVSFWIAAGFVLYAWRKTFDFPKISIRRLLTTSLGLAALCVLLFILIKYHKKLTRMIMIFFLIVFPFALLTITQAAWVLVEGYLDSRRISRLKFYEETPGRFYNPKAVWIIFDEMDQRIIFNDRPDSIELPEFDRFKSQAVYAEQAFPPGKGTPESLPAFTAGEMVSEVVSSSLYDLNLIFRGDDKPVNWSEKPSIFQKIRKLGLTTAAGGWVIPYHKVFQNDLNVLIPPEDKRPPLIQTMYFQFLAAAAYVPVYTKTTVINHKKLLKYAAKTAVDKSINFIFIHFMPPHGPWIYDNIKKEYSYSTPIINPRGYYNNLVLADRTLRELRQAMERENLWDDSVILITSDHWYRRSNEIDGVTDHRVPFMLKLAGQTKPFVYDKPFNAVLSHDLILAVFKKEIKTPEEAMNWLDENRLKVFIPNYD